MSDTLRGHVNRYVILGSLGATLGYTVFYQNYHNYQKISVGITYLPSTLEFYPAPCLDKVDVLQARKSFPVSLL